MIGLEHWQCRACGKVAHATRDLAGGHLLLLRHAGKAREREIGQSLHTYYCEIAGGWHVGHDRRSEREAA